MTIRFPAPLRPGDCVAVCAVSAGVPEVLQGRLEASLQALRTAGYQVVEGATLRRQHKQASGSAAERLADLERFLFDPQIRAILPPWGGERAIELLPLLDWPRLAASEAKWLCGFSDVSTLAVPLALRAGWATLHAPNLFDLSEPARQPEMQALWHSWRHGVPPAQTASQAVWLHGDNLQTAASSIRLLHGEDACIEGRLLGGCLDVLMHLAGTPFFDLSAWQGTPIVLYLENAELRPCSVLRALSGMRLAGCFNGLSGLVLGRSSAANASDERELSYDEAVALALDGLPCPVVLDADIGHLPPQWSLLNGAWARLEVTPGKARLEQWCEGPHA